MMMDCAAFCCHVTPSRLLVLVGQGEDRGAYPSAFLINLSCIAHVDSVVVCKGERELISKGNENTHSSDGVQISLASNISVHMKKFTLPS